MTGHSTAMPGPYASPCPRLSGELCEPDTGHERTSRGHSGVTLLDPVEHCWKKGFHRCKKVPTAWCEFEKQTLSENNVLGWRLGHIFRSLCASVSSPSRTGALVEDMHFKTAQ